MTARLVIAGAASGVGKTTVTVGLLAALRRRGLRVAPFKAGPDYIDPSYHALAAGTPGTNLDPWLVPPDALAAAFARVVQGAEIAVIEGVMGLFDGFGYDDLTGSTAALAGLLAAPIVVVLDVQAQARSAAAAALGFARFDPAVTLAGFILNRVGSEGHYQGVKGAVEAATGLPVFGGLPHEHAATIPERHLGLIPAVESPDVRTAIDAAADLVERHCAVDALLHLARTAPPLPRPAVARITAATPPETHVRIAMAQDAAFSFTYTENRDALQDAGAEIVPFSPCEDARLPADSAGIILGGGFPEVYAAKLAANASMREAIRAAITAGIPCVAECGGLMYLTEALVGADGARYAMVGALPGEAVMADRLQLGYATVTALRDTPLLREGETVRGHEFHYSRWEGAPETLPHAYALTRRPGDPTRHEGYAQGALLASYVHLHYWSNPALATRFVATCATYARQAAQL